VYSIFCFLLPFVSGEKVSILVKFQIKFTFWFFQGEKMLAIFTEVVVWNFFFLDLTLLGKFHFFFFFKKIFFHPKKVKKNQ